MNPSDWSYVDDEPWPTYPPEPDNRVLLALIATVFAVVLVLLWRNR